MTGVVTRGNTKNLGPQWQPGQSGNPAGRPKGARSKLGEAFIEAMHKDFNEHGPATIVEVRETRPDQYLKVIASLIPKELTLNLNDERTDLTNDELVERIRKLSETITPFLAGGNGDAAARAGDAAGAQQPPHVH